MQWALAAIAAFALSHPALAQSAAPKGAAAPPASGASADHAGMNHVMAEGTGVVRSVDAKAGTVTLQHDPIPALQWPAMTMAFKANPPSLVQSLKAGQSVKFQVMQMNGATQLVAVQPR